MNSNKFVDKGSTKIRRPRVAEIELAQACTSFSRTTDVSLLRYVTLGKWEHKWTLAMVLCYFLCRPKRIFTSATKIRTELSPSLECGSPPERLIESPEGEYPLQMGL
jgi:hypothetical protein